MEKDMLTEQELADFLKMKPATLANWRSRGEGPKFIKLGGKSVRYLWEDVKTYLADHTIDADATKEADK